MTQAISPKRFFRAWLPQAKNRFNKILANRSLANSIANIALAFILFTYSISSLAASLHIAVAANFITPIKQLATQFEQETDIQLQLSFGSSGKLYAQIQHGAPFDIFLSADQTKPNRLIKEKLAQAESLVIYARGKLVLWSAKPMKKTRLKETFLTAQRIAIANPKLAPYGKAAEQSLHNLGIWSKVKDKLVMGENIGQTYQFVYSQNADVGLVALSQVFAGQLDGYLHPVPEKLYREIKQAAVVLSHTKQTTQAKVFMAFLMRPDIQQKIIQFGYSAKHP